MILSHPSAPLGSVLALPNYTTDAFVPSAAILCRNTAPLITFAYGLLTRSVACRVLGREIGKGLTSLIDKLNAKGIPQLEEKLDLYRTREVTKALAKGQDSAAAAIDDKCDCIGVFIRNLRETERTISALVRKIESLFSDDGSAVGVLTLATIHKSKGLEWPLVFLLDRDLIPSKYARQDWQKRQEFNLLYVAVTRAKLDLRYISSGCWQKPTAPMTQQQKALLED